MLLYKKELRKTGDVFEKLKWDGGSVEQAPIPFMSHLPRIRIPPIIEDEFRSPRETEEEERQGKGKEGSQRRLQQSPCAIDGRTSGHTPWQGRGKEEIEGTSISSSHVVVSKKEINTIHCMLRFIRCGCSEKKVGGPYGRTS